MGQQDRTETVGAYTIFQSHRPPPSLSPDEPSKRESGVEEKSDEERKAHRDYAQQCLAHLVLRKLFPSTARLLPAAGLLLFLRIAFPEFLAT